MRTTPTKLRLVIVIISALICVAFNSACGGGGGGGGANNEQFAAVALEPELLVPAIDFPVGLAFLPDGRLLFTELRTGRVRVYLNGQLFERPFATMPVPEVGADGVLGVAADSNFKANHFVYVFHVEPAPLRGVVTRFEESGGVGMNPTVIADNLPVGGHNGGKLLSAKDGSLYITQGDTGSPALAQNPNTTAGKILRVTREGKAAPNNPAAESPIYASGFRNVFGIAELPESGELFVTDNGPDCDDEINLLQPGGNYGWREAQPCSDTDQNYLQPIVRISPSIGVTGLAVYSGDAIRQLEGDLLLADYNTGAIRRYRLNSANHHEVIASDVVFPGGLGSVTDLSVGPDGLIYFIGGNNIFRLTPKTEESPVSESELPVN